MKTIWHDFLFCNQFSSKKLPKDARKLVFGSIYDRTKTLFPDKIKIITDIPELLHYNKTFEYCIQQRTDELVSLKKPIHLFWSGGIDSTLVLISLLNSDCKDLTVYSTNMVRLNILSSCNIKTKFINAYQYREHIQNILDNEELLVTGELADQIMGSLTAFDHKNSGKEVSLDNLSFIIKQHTSNNTDVDCLIDMFRETMSKCPFKINDIIDYFWWLNFSCKWQHVEFRILNGVHYNENTYRNCVKHFFNTIDFQLWSMQEHNHKIKYDNGRYKDVMLNYIEKSKYKNFLFDKTKVPSLDNQSIPETTLYIDENFNNVQYNVFLSDPTFIISELHNANIFGY